MKTRKFQSGGISEDIRQRALKYASMARPDTTEESEEQKAMLRSQPGREPEPQTRKLQPSMKARKELDDLIARQSRKYSSKAAMEDAIEEMNRRNAKTADDYRVLDAAKRKDNFAGAEEGNAYQEADEKLRRNRMMKAPSPADIGMSDEDYSRRIKGQGLEDVYPESVVGGMGLKGLRSLASKLAGRKEAQDVAEEFGRAGSARALAERARRQKMAEDVRNAQARRKAASEARKARETSRMESEGMGSITPRMSPKREAPPPRDFDELRMSGEGMGFKKGGKAHKKFAQGGSVSARADGIAKRGKTNCKIC